MPTIKYPFPVNLYGLHPVPAAGYRGYASIRCVDKTCREFCRFLWFIGYEPPAAFQFFEPLAGKLLLAIMACDLFLSVSFV